MSSATRRSGPVPPARLWTVTQGVSVVAALAVVGLFLLSPALGLSISGDILVPLRLVDFNQNGPALAIFVVTVLFLVLPGGISFAGKAGWCTAVCPVLPVERLQRTGSLRRARARALCSGCVRACPDLHGHLRPGVPRVGGRILPGSSPARGDGCLLMGAGRRGWRPWRPRRVGTGLRVEHAVEAAVSDSDDVVTGEG